jgi:hypothetical protein
MSHMKRLLDEDPHGICEAYIVSQETALNTLKDQNQELIDALGKVLDWIDGEAPDFKGSGSDEAGEIWWQGFDTLAKARGERIKR